MSNSSDLPRLVGSVRPGSRAVVQVWRKSATRDVALVVGEMQEEKVANHRSNRGIKPNNRSANRLGLVVSELSPEQRRELKVNGGLLIEDVVGSTARADLRPGDVVLALIHKGTTTEIKGVEQFNKLLSQFAKGSNITLLVRRGEMQTFVTIKGLNGD